MMIRSHTFVERYPGPSDSGKKITRNYIIGLAIGLVIIIFGMFANVFGLALAGFEVIDPGARTGDQGVAVIETNTEASPILGVAMILIGGIINLGSIYRFNKETSQLPEYKSRTKVIATGLIVTILFVIIAGYSSFALFQ